MTNKEAIKEINLVKKLFRENRPLIALEIAIKALEREETCQNDTNGKGDFYCDKCHCWIEQRETEVLDTGVRHYFNYCPNCGRKVEE